MSHDHALCYAGFLAFIRGVDIPETVEQARLVLVERMLKAESQLAAEDVRTCEFCQEPDGDPPAMLDVCPACWRTRGDRELARPKRHQAVTW